MSAASPPSLEDKLALLMKALRGVDPQTLAAGASNNRQNSETAVSPPKADPAATESSGETAKPAEADAAPLDLDDFVVDVVKVAKETASSAPVAAVAPAAAAQPQPAAAGLESLMRQYVSTLRTEIECAKPAEQAHLDSQQPVKPSPTAQLVLEAKSKSAGAGDAETVDYSKMSMAELLDQIDELVDQTSATNQQAGAQ